MELQIVKIPVYTYLPINTRVVGGGDISQNIINNPEYFEIKEKYMTMINDYREKESDQFIGGMPVQIESDCIKQLIRVNKYNNQLVYSMTLKADGERYLLFVTLENDVYLINRSTDIFSLKFKFSDKVRGPLLLDGELIEHSPGKYEYLAFDILFYPSVSGTLQSCIFQNFSIRTSILQEVVKSMNSEFVNLKQWFPITDITKTGSVYKYISTETNKQRKKAGLTPLKSDGIILQPNDGVYVTFREWNKYNNVQFKWKPSDELTIDFKIKIISKDQWNLLSNTGMQFMVQQPKGKNPEPAMCFPTQKQAGMYSDGDVIEFKYQNSDNPQRNLFTPVRTRNEKNANGYKTIMSTLRSIENPFELEQIKDPLKIITSNEIMKKESLKKVLSVFTKSDLILFILNKKDKLFFSEKEIKKFKNIYELKSQETELEFRIFTGTKKGTVMDKTNFYYILDFLWDSFEHTYSYTIDIYLNKRSDDLKKYRSTYRSVKDVYNGNPYENLMKATLESTKILNNKGLYNGLQMKLDVSVEEKTNTIVKLKNNVGTNNMIRSKHRYSFIVNDLWRLDLTRVKTGYTLPDIESKNDTFECECEFIGPVGTPFQEFLESMNKVYTLVLSNSSYC